MAVKTAGKNAGNGQVESRTLLKTQVDEEDSRPHFEAVPQLEGKPPYKVTYPMISPERADKMIKEADLDPEFKQRPLSTRDVRRWQILMETDRFVHYLPNGPICYDPDGMMLNGKHRLTAVAGQNKPHGFMVIENVPRWMFPYFDTGRPRSLNDVFNISGKVPKQQQGSTIRLAMRYTEVMRGQRAVIGWQNWFQQRDEHVDVQCFLDDHEEIMDSYGLADSVYKKVRLNISALMVWRYFQQMAWPGPECTKAISKFWLQIHKGEMMRGDDPAALLREWTMETYYNRDKIRGKRELHLLLLNHHFRKAQGRNPKMEKMAWAYGWHMQPPYHPDGPEYAIKNILRALDG